MVTETSQSVYGKNRRDGFIRTRLESRAKMPVFNTKGTSICDSHIDSYEYVCVFIETIYVNTVPNYLKYNVYDNIEANWINISELNIFGKYAQIWAFSSLLGEPKILTYQDEVLKSFR